MSLPNPDFYGASSTNNQSRRGSATSGSVTLEVLEESSSSSDEISYTNDINPQIKVSSYVKNVKRKSDSLPYKPPITAT